MAQLVWASIIAGSATDYLIDNTTASSALHKISCKSFGVAALAFEFWKEATKQGSHAWIGEVRSKLNIADCPTRQAKYRELKQALGNRLKVVDVPAWVKDRVMSIIGGKVDFAI